MSETVSFNRVSLLDRIKNAKSNDELLAMETEGSGYEYASVNTQVKWAKASLARKNELKKVVENPEKTRAKTDKKGTKKG